MTAPLDLDLLKTFLTVVETGGFNRAAAELHRTPAAVSQQIKRLEQAIGKRVLDRSNQGIVLTAAGNVLRERGQRLMAMNYELMGRLRDGELSGPLSFGAPADYAPALLKQLLPIFQREFPLTTPTISLEPSRVLRRKIAAGTLDMAITAQEPGSTDGTTLWSEEIAWFGSATEGRTGVLATDCVLRDHALSVIRNAKSPMRIVLEAVTVAALSDAVQAGFCNALLPVSMGSGMMRRSELGLTLAFTLIHGARMEARSAAQTAERFRRALG